jgi:DNA-binding response OmpR family regulator
MILLVSANWPQRALLKAQLEEAGLEVAGAASFDEAVQWLIREPKVGLLILDTLGLALDRTFLEGIAAMRIPVLLVSGPFEQAEWDLSSFGIDVKATLHRPVFIGDVVRAAQNAKRKTQP